MLVPNHGLALLNSLANLPDVLPNIAPGHTRVDLKAFFERTGNLMVGDWRGVVLFIYLGEGLYAAHWLFDPAYRGTHALRAIREAFCALFTYREAVAITGLVPRENRASCAMARALGCRRMGVSHDTHGRSCNSYIMERTTWAILSGA